MAQNEDAYIEEADGEIEGRCAAVTNSGKRCPNASLSSSRYCGIPSHQRLEQEKEEAEETLAAQG